LEHLNLCMDKISTFDISNSLDESIGASRLEYEIYKNNKNKQLEQGVQTLGADLQAIIKETIGRRKVFSELLNGLFRATNKTFLEDTFSFKLDNQTYNLSYEQLSSGEKQIFYILLKTLIQDKKPSILLLDEPEISLHIEWQRELLRHIRDLNPNCQIIAVTHSSNMYFRYWAKHKFDVTDIQVEKLNGQLNGLTNSVMKRFADELKLLIEKNTPRLLNDINDILHKRFYEIPYEDSRAIIKALENEGIKADHYTYTILMAKSQHLQDALQLLKDMKAQKIRPNGVTYTNILKKSDTFDDALSIFDEMRNDGVEPVIQHFGILLGRADNSDYLQRVEELRAFYGVSPNEVYSNKLRIKQ
jgi:pentatricopeptide repeat protein